MADDTNFRSYRPADQRWPAQAKPASGGREGGNDRNDPLAELARLIGQTDPFAELSKTAPPRSAAAPVRAAAAMPPRPSAAPAPASDPYGSPLQFSGEGFDRGYQASQPESFQPAYDPAIYGTPQPQAADPGYPSEAYYDDPSRLPQGDESYDEDYGEERPRRGLKLALVLGAFAILGVGGALGYRAVFSGGPSGPPPVIKANAAPSKIVPAPTADSNNKQIYDRVGDVSQGERVVSREERPVEVKDNSRPAPRSVFPGVSNANAQDSAMGMASPPLPTDPGGPSSAEPKKIRTVTIRPDGNGGSSVVAPAPRSNGTQTASRAPAAIPMDQAPPATAASRSAPLPIAANPAPAPQGNAPLSLSPQVASAEASAARPAFPPPPRQAAPAAPTRLAAVPPAGEVASGGAHVQISSQRSESEAQASFRSLQAKFPSLLGDRQPVVRRADLGEKGIYFRAMVGPFASVEQATQFCGSLKSAGGQCVVQRN